MLTEAVRCGVHSRKGNGHVCVCARARVCVSANVHLLAVFGVKIVFHF